MDNAATRARLLGKLAVLRGLADREAGQRRIGEAALHRKARAGRPGVAPGRRPRRRALGRGRPGRRRRGRAAWLRGRAAPPQHGGQRLAAGQRCGVLRRHGVRITLRQ